MSSLWYYGGKSRNYFNDPSHDPIHLYACDDACACDANVPNAHAYACACACALPNAHACVHACVCVHDDANVRDDDRVHLYLCVYDDANVHDDGLAYACDDDDDDGRVDDDAIDAELFYGPIPNGHCVLWLYQSQ
jgi:hypothetical protein